MKKHTKIILKVFAAIIAVAFVILVVVSIGISNNNAAEYRSQMSNQIAQVYPNFDEQREKFYDLTGIDEIVENEETKRNQLFNEFYDSLSISNKSKVDGVIDTAINNIYSSIDFINSKLEQLTDMFESATEEELETFQNDFKTTSEELTSKIDAFYTDLLTNQ